MNAKLKMQPAHSEHYDLISEVVGEDVLPVVKYLRNKKNISEFKIAESIKEEVNRVRNMLYRLQENNLVTYYRKKDRIKGWYISYWSLNPTGIKCLRSAITKQRLDMLKERLEKEEENKNSYYLCPNGCTRLDLERSTECEFRCPECGEILNLQDNTKTIDYIRVKIKELQSGKA